MRISLDPDNRAPDIDQAWQAYKEFYALRPDVDSEAVRRAFAFAYQEGFRTGKRQMAGRVRAALAPTVEELAELAKDPNQKPT